MKIKKIFILILFLVLICSCNKEKSLSTKLILCDYSEEYKNYLSLSEEEKKQTVMPVICKSQEEDITFLSSDGLAGDALPTSYDLRNIEGNNYVPSVKNQLSQNTCWTFSANTSLESYLLLNKNIEYDFSERHLEYSVTKSFLNNEINPLGFNRVIDTGGNQYMTGAYLMNNQGPVLETDMPYLNSHETIALSEIQNKDIIYDINSYEIATYNLGNCSNGAIEKIKNNIMNYGAVNSSMYYNASYYKSSTYGYYYLGPSNINHAISIIGWDDNYPASNFNSNPSRNGAFLIQNSWGSTFANNGTFYISYDDSTICSMFSTIRDLDNDLEDKLYYLDPLGYNISAGNDDNTFYVANVFTREESLELVTEVTFGTMSRSLNYEIYINPKNNTLNSTSLNMVASGSVNYSGYHTIKLDTPVKLTGNSFAIAMKLNTPKSTYPAAFSSNQGSIYQDVTIGEGKCFGGSSLDTLEDLSDDTQKFIPSLRASTNYFRLTNNDLAISNNIIVNNLESIASFKTKLTNNFDSDLAIYDNSLLNEFTEGNIGTGYKIAFPNADNELYTISVLGDNNGNGTINMADIMRLATHLVDGNIITKKEEVMAADVTKDSNLRMNDVMKLATYLVEGGSL